MSEMDVDCVEREIDLTSPNGSPDDGLSYSSSILNTPNREREGDDFDNVEDSLNESPNATIVCNIPVPALVKGQNEIPPKEKKVKLSGAGVRRFKRLLENGHSAPEARILAKQMTSKNDSSKRPRDESLNGSSSSGNNPTPKKVRDSGLGKKSHPLLKTSVQHRLEIAKEGSSGSITNPVRLKQSSYTEVVKYVRVGVMSKNYPHVELTMQQLAAIQKAILINVIQQRKKKLKPKFGTCQFRPGFLIVLCKNQETVEWLKAIIPTISVGGDIELMTVDDNFIPQPDALIGFFPRSAEDSNDTILALLESQNEGLIIDAWRILRRKVINQQHVELTFLVDGSSLQTIKTNSFVLDYKFGNALIRKQPQKKLVPSTIDGNEGEGVNTSDGGCGRQGQRLISDCTETSLDAGEACKDVPKSNQEVSANDKAKVTVHIDNDSDHTINAPRSSNSNHPYFVTQTLGYREINIQSLLGDRESMVREQKSPPESEKKFEHD